ncbi:MAG: hypothetical protein K8F91_15615 [Candidatus Obscuribacterales bacterium]|nr:hypothetical protein [Candidatus Obscuribacterales bacterium]
MSSFCAYCGNNLEGDNFICASCSAACLQTASHAQVIQAADQKEGLPSIKEPLPKIKREATNPVIKSSTNQSVSTSNRVSKKGSLSRRKKNKSSAQSDNWIKTPVHSDFTARGKVICTIVFIVCTVIAIQLCIVSVTHANNNIFSPFSMSAGDSAGAILTLASFLLIIVGLTFIYTIQSCKTQWNKFASFVYEQEESSDCTIQLIFEREPYLVREIVLLEPDRKKTADPSDEYRESDKETSYRVVLSHCPPVAAINYLNMHKTIRHSYKATVKHGKNGDTEAIIFSIGGVRFWCMPV